MQNTIQKGSEKQINKEDICPKCGALLYRDEHPDGIAVGNWQCSNCDWFQEVILGHLEAEDLPF